MELVLMLLLAMLGFGLFVRDADRTEMVIAVILFFGLTGAIWWRIESAPAAGSPNDPASAERPLELAEAGYVSSDACRSCHPAEYATWKHSYHRTMTQILTPESMLADWDGTELEIRNRVYRLEQEGDQYWVDMVDPEFTPKRRFDGRPVASKNQTKRIRRRVVQSTGSHHQQIFWFSRGKGRELYLLPFTWLVDDARWIPYDASLMWLPSGRETTEEWVRVCMRCHSTGGQPRPVAYSDAFDTHVGELGISCEACHGPAEAHVEQYQDPVERYKQYASESVATKIVNPANLDALTASQVCAQCHSHSDMRGEAEKKRARTIGYSFRPGDDFNETRVLHVRPEDSESLTPFQLYSEDSISWRDGMVRTAGRDYHGLLDTPCLAGGEYSCLSCHAMHDYEERDDQLKPGMRTNAACLQCHPKFEAVAALESHTNHRAASSGSLCYDCHMPHSSYALLKGVRSHSLSSPTVSESIDYGRPNACNLCHLDQTLAWTQNYLEDWYGYESPPADPLPDSGRAAAVDWLLEGDAAQRGLIAWAMSKPQAQETSGTRWMAPLLARLLTDEYPAVSLIAQRTLNDLREFDDLHVTGPDDRARVLERWKGLPGESVPGARAYQKSPAVLDIEAIDAAYARRDRRRVNVAE